ncbi:MAG: type restriction-modification system methyltransferase subunit [Verrucomicrobiales bacterium]|nr:type restriction-modification system methyltransferase subunit [Verrucomicrobiales bacterium]
MESHLLGSPLEVRLEEVRRAISNAKPKQPKELKESPELYHGWMQPYLIGLDQLIWQRWEHWFEMMDAGRMVGEIPPIHWQRNDAGFKMLDRALSCITRYGDWRGWGNWSAFEYFMDWLLFGFGHTGQPELPEERDDYKGASDRLYQVFNLEPLLAYPHDYLADILAENQHGRHVGFFPTPMDLCALMGRMTIGDEDARTKSVMDPCVGTGRMLLAASNYSYRLYGCDINPTVIKVTLINGFLYAPWLVRPLPFVDSVLADPSQSQRVSDSLAAQAPAQLQGTQHDAEVQWQFEPIKKRQRTTTPVAEPGLLLEF